MPDGIKIEIKGLPELKAQLLALPGLLEQRMEKVLDKHALAISTKAKQRAPVDEGILRNSLGISVSTGNKLSRVITVNTPYAAFMEFGTGKYAAEYIASLPDDWQAYAAQFRGQKGGTFDEMIRNLTDWVHRHSQFGEGAVTGTFSVKSHRRTGNKKTRQDEDRQAAYFIALKILKNGVKAQPFIFPAYKAQLPLLLADAQKILG